MKNKFSRRQFLRGAGGITLALPFMPSLLSKEALAQSSGPTPKRFLCLYWPHGYRNQYWGAPLSSAASIVSSQSQNSLHTIKELAFSSVSTSTNLNPTLPYPAFNSPSMRSKLTIIQGLDQIGIGNGHNRYGALGATLHEPATTDGELQSESIDTILARSTQIYPDFTPLRRVMNISSTGGSISLQRNSSGVGFNESPSEISFAQVWQKLFSGVSGSGDSGAALEKDKKTRLINLVYEDYQRKLNHPRLSAEDRQKLESRMTMFDELEAKIQGIRVSASCTPPPETNIGPNSPDNYSAWYQMSMDQKFRFYIDLVVAAIICDTTRVATFDFYGTLKNGEDPFPNDFHTEHAHGHDPENHQKMLEHNQWAAELYAHMITQLDAQEEAPGVSILDNSLVYWANELGNTTPANGHSTKEMQIMLAGSLGGRIRTGRYLEYRRTYGSTVVGPPYNHFLVSILQAFGLTPSEYEGSTEEAPGIGEYGLTRPAGIPNRAAYEVYLTTAQRRSPLPLLFT